MVATKFDEAIAIAVERVSGLTSVCGDIYDSKWAQEMEAIIRVFGNTCGDINDSRWAQEMEAIIRVFGDTCGSTEGVGDIYDSKWAQEMEAFIRAFGSVCGASLGVDFTQQIEALVRIFGSSKAATQGVGDINDSRWAQEMEALIRVFGNTCGDMNDSRWAQEMEAIMRIFGSTCGATEGVGDINDSRWAQEMEAIIRIFGACGASVAPAETEAVQLGSQVEVEVEEPANPFAARREIMQPKELRERINQIKIEKDGHEPHNVQTFTKEEVAAAIYHNTNRIYGSKQPAKLEKSTKGLNGHFTDHLVRAGMPRNNSLNCTMDKGRFIAGAGDWVNKL